MFIERAQQRKHRSYGWVAAITLGAVGLVCLAIVLARSDTDRGPVSAAPAAAVAATAPQAAASGAAAAAQEQLADLQGQIVKSSQELGNLRATADQVRAEVTALREQRDAALQAPAVAQPPAAETTGSQQSQPAQPVQSAPPAAQPASPGQTVQPAQSAQPVQPTQQAPVQQAAAPAEHRSTVTRHAHTARGYMLLAREYLESGRTAEAADALEKAETRVLNSNAASHAGQDPTEGPLVDNIENARRALRSGNTALALRLTGSPPARPDRHSSASR